MCDYFSLLEKENKNIDVKVYLKIRIYYTYENDDIYTISMVYYQVLEINKIASK